MKARRAAPGRDNPASDGGRGVGRRRRDAFTLVELLGMRIDPEGGGGIVQWPEAYHNRSANFTFADGHAQGHRWQDARTTPPLRRGSRLAEWGFPLAGNPDARWIRDHATSRARQ